MEKLDRHQAGAELSDGYCCEKTLCVSVSPCVMDRDIESFYSNRVSINICV